MDDSRVVLKCWFFLILAIVLEIFGGISLKYFVDFGVYICTVLVLLSYFCFSKSLIRINLSVAYLLWESLGLVGISIISYFLLHESLNFTKSIGIVILIIGSILIHRGSYNVNEVRKNV